MTDSEENSKFNKRIAFAEQATRQEFYLCFCLIVLTFAISTSLSLFILFVYVQIIYKRGRAKIASIPNGLDASLVPPNTLIVITQKRKGFYSWFSEKLGLQGEGFSTQSWYFANIIYVPPDIETKPKYSWGVQKREMQLLHEYMHCGRGEFLTLLLVLFCSLISIISSIESFLYLLGTPGQTYSIHVCVILLCLYFLCTSGQMMRRREFIADFKAYALAGSKYIEFVENEVKNKDLCKENSATKKYNLKYIWHPSWSDRLDFLKNQDRITLSDYMDLYSSALLCGFSSLLACYAHGELSLGRDFMRLYSSDILGSLTGIHSFYFNLDLYNDRPFLGASGAKITLVSAALDLTFLIAFCWLIARSAKFFPLNVLILLTFTHYFSQTIGEIWQIYHFSYQYQSAVNFHHFRLFIFWVFILIFVASWYSFLNTTFLFLIPDMRKNCTRVITLYIYILNVTGFAMIVDIIVHYWPRFNTLIKVDFPIFTVVKYISAPLIFCTIFEISRRVFPRWLDTMYVFLHNKGNYKLKAFWLFFVVFMLIFSFFYPLIFKGVTNLLMVYFILICFRSLFYGHSELLYAPVMFKALSLRAFILLKKLYLFLYSSIRFLVFCARVILPHLNSILRYFRLPQKRP